MSNLVCVAVVVSGVQSLCRPYELLQRALQERPPPGGHPYFRKSLQRQKTLYYIVENTLCCLYVFVFLLINVAVSFLWKELGGTVIKSLACDNKVSRFYFHSVKRGFEVSLYYPLKLLMCHCSLFGHLINFGYMKFDYIGCFFLRQEFRLFLKYFESNGNAQR